MHITYLYTMIIKLMHVLVMYIYIVYFGCMNWDKIAWYKLVQTEKKTIHYMVLSDKL